MARVTFDGLYALCNKLHWFTGGSVEQYEKMFDLAREGASLKELALVIWMCTPDRTRENIEKILDDEFGGAK